MFNPFSQICHALLAGQVIDETYYPALFRALGGEEMLNRVNAYLEQIDRRCVPTQNGSGFYCVYTRADTAEVQKAVSAQFNLWVKTLEPLLMWLRLCRGVQDDDAPIRGGEIIRHADLMRHITLSTHAREQLAGIVRLLDRSSTTADKMLASVLDYLVKEQYLKPLDKGNLSFRATAKWDLLYEQLAYIAVCENIDDDVPGAQQEVLL